MYACFEEEETGHWCIVMEKIPGVSLEIALDGYTKQEREQLTEQLRAMVASMRQHQREEIGSFDTSLRIGPASDDLFICKERAGPLHWSKTS